MVYIRPESTKINEIEYVRVLLKQLISFLENKYLKNSIPSILVSGKNIWLVSIPPKYIPPCGATGPL